MITTQSSPNIALIKYWGNRNDEWRLPMADSLSMTLDSPLIQAQIEASDVFITSSFDAQGRIKLQSDAAIMRLKKHWNLTKQYLKTIEKADGLPEDIKIVIRSAIPPAVGIASSAAIFSALAEGYAALLKPPNKLTREEISVIARLGSGSAARSIFGGYAGLLNTGEEGIGSACGRQVATEQHWLLHDIIIVPSREEKKVGSTEGHALAKTSPLFQERIRQIPRRMKECADAILKKDFEKLQRISEEDSLDMHRVMQTQTPPLEYLSDATHRIIRDIEKLRKNDALNVLYTMDAGPTVHLICTEDSREAVETFAQQQKDCIVLKAKTGSGSRLKNI